MTGGYLRVQREPNGAAEILYVGGELDICSGPILLRVGVRLQKYLLEGRRGARLILR
jgi:hypothetical protein